MSRMLNPSRIYTRVKTVAVAGTAEQLSSDYPVPDGISVMVKGSPGNTGNVFIAGSQSDAQTSANRYTLRPNETVELQVTNLSQIWIDAATSADGVEYIFEA